jgi:hypothetical protein
MQREHMLSPDDNFADANDYAAFETQTFAYSVLAILQRSRRFSGKAMGAVHRGS